ncbi:hypothetical protein B0H14DRAFT_2618876 [Mycena olivaceomarginata]|nr:hypothetical protein B0H14DRAFT_2618876 [Mycena olivaceomarginata]
MKRMVDNDSPSRRQRASDAMSKRSQKSRTTEVNTPLRKAFMRRQKQASFRVSRSDDSPAESDAVPGRVDIFRDDHKVGQLALNDTQKPYTLYGLPKRDNAPGHGVFWQRLLHHSTVHRFDSPLRHVRSLPNRPRVPEDDALHE